GHDHHQQTGEVDAAVVHDGQDEVAHVQPQAGEGDGADDDADDHAAHPHGDGSPGPLHGGGDDLVPGHAGVPAQPAGGHGGEDGDDGGVEGGIAHAHGGDEHHQG